MNISLSACGGVDFLSLLSCGICKGLAINPLSHNGGNSQPFCQRLFCSVCVSLIQKNPIYVQQSKFSGKILRKNKKDPSSPPVAKPFGFIDCPVDSCQMDFRQPYFTEPGLVDMMVYSRVQVTCSRCLMIYPIYDYLAHMVNCSTGVATVPQASRVNNYNLVSRSLANSSLVSGCSYESQFTGVSVNSFGPGRFINNNIINIRIRSSGKANLDLSFSLDTKIADVFRTIASTGNFNPDAIDLVSFQHVVLSQFETLKDFVSVIRRSGDVTLIDRIPPLANRDCDLNLTVRCCYQRDLVRYPRQLDEE